MLLTAVQVIHFVTAYPLLTKLISSRWLNIAQLPVVHFYELRQRQGKKKKILNEQAWSIKDFSLIV